MSDRGELALRWLPGRFAVARLDPAAALPEWALAGTTLLSITRTSTELSIVASEDAVPDSCVAERDFVACAVVGTLDFALTGILARLTTALADAQISVFAISTYDTDILLVKSNDRDRAEQVLGTVAMWIS